MPGRRCEEGKCGILESIRQQIGNIFKRKGRKNAHVGGTFGLAKLRYCEALKYEVTPKVLEINITEFN